MTLACSVAKVPVGRTTPGPHRATAVSAAEWLGFLAEHGVSSQTVPFDALLITPMRTQY